MSAPQVTAQWLPIRMERILFASDFTESSEMALPYAAAFARLFGARIMALHVVSPEEYARIPSEQRETMLEALKIAAAERLKRVLLAAHLEGIAFRVQVEYGEVLDTIVSIAATQHADMIVAGSHGRHGIQKLLAPAVEEEIAIASLCPVLLVGPEVSVSPESEAHIRRVLYATDLEKKSKPALEYAYALARACSARLLLLHVADDVWREPLSTRMSAEGFCRMRMLKSGLPEHEPGVEVEFQVEFGECEQMILEVAQGRDAQLIVMGISAAAHPELKSHLPGPLAYDVATHAACPVLAVRSAPPNPKQEE